MPRKLSFKIKKNIDNSQFYFKYGDMLIYLQKETAYNSFRNVKQRFSEGHNSVVNFYASYIHI